MQNEQICTYLTTIITFMYDLTFVNARSLLTEVSHQQKPACPISVIKFYMAESTVCESQARKQERTPPHRQLVSFHYQMADMKARKMVALIKFSKLGYDLQQNSDESKPFLLKTAQGQLYDEYEIVNYIVNDSFVNYYKEGLQENSRSDGSQAQNQNQAKLVSLCGNDIFLWAKMNQKLYDLRKNLFVLLEEFYRYLLGHEKVRKSKYDGLLNKIKKEILKLDQMMSQNGEIFSIQSSFLSIIIACEMFMACKFVFEEKFRKSKWTLFSKCQKIAKKPQFQQIYGKASFCVKQCLPVQFQQQEEPQLKKLEEAIPIEIVKLVQSPQIAFTYNEKRNELLYNFFKNTLKGQQSKISYFPYFWLMYDNLLCNLVQIVYYPDREYTYQQLEKNLVIALNAIPKFLKSIDYGFLAIYQNQKDRHHLLQGLICLGSHSFEEFTEEIQKNSELRGFRALKVDITSEQQRRKVQVFWEYQIQGVSFQGIKLINIRQF